MIDQDFDRAKEKAVLIGAAYDFGKLAHGACAPTPTSSGAGTPSIPPRGKKAPNQSEYDFTVDYRPPFQLPVLQGMWFRFRSAILDQQDAKTLGYQFRIIINWDRDLI